MLRKFFLAAIPLLGASALANMQETETNRIVNPDFAAGSTGWRIQGAVTFVDGRANFGPKAGRLFQSYSVLGSHILFVSAKIKTSAKSVGIRLRAQCLDAKGKCVLDLPQVVDPEKASKAGDEPGIYFKTHPFTRSVTVSIEKESRDGSAIVDDVLLRDDDHDRVVHDPEIDLDEAMRPIWEGNRVYDETVLLYSDRGESGSGKLLYEPKSVVSVRSSDLRTTYELGKDYTVEGRRIIRTMDSRMPLMTKADFPSTPYPWVNLAGKHVTVTYTHDDDVALPIPGYVGSQLPNTMEKLNGKKPLTVVALGDSITLGINVSGFLGSPPYQPPYPDLFVHQLGKLYGDDRITLHNVALGGMTSQWGKDNANALVASLKPDLVIIAFGMNDFWSLTPDLFAANIRDTIRIIRKSRPKAEFLLVASMKFDPAYTTESVYVNNLAGYPAALRALTGPGIQLFDMTALSQALYDQKSQRDLATDPMHPDDFLGRFYAQGLVAMLQRPDAPATKKGIGVWNELMTSDPIRAVHASWYYNWSPEPTRRAPKGVEFVPMLWGWSPGEQARNLLALRQSGAKHFLGFNEPDGKDQSNIAPEVAIAAWPQLVKAGLPLGSPAAVHAEGPWMQTFMKGIVEQKLPVDFVTVHWYYLPDVNGFLAYLKKVHEQYGKPIWITEFACVDWDKKPGQSGRFTSAEVARFVRELLPKLDKIPWIHRYAWFSADGPYAESNLFNADGTLTEVGKAYAGDK